MRRRLFVSTLLITIAAFVAISFVTTLFIGNDLRQKTHEQLALACATANAAARSLSDDELVPALREAAKAGNHRVTLIARDGTVLYDSETSGKLENHAGRPEVIEALAKGTGTAVRYSATLKCDVMYVAMRMEGGDEILRFSDRLSTVWDDLGSIMNGIVWVALGLLVLCGITVWLVAGRIFRPIDEMTNVSQTIAGGRYDLRISSRISARDELGKLSRAFNSMADRLESTIGDLHQENEKFGAVLEAMSDGILAVDLQFRVTLANRRMMQLLGVSTEPLGKHILEATRMESLETLIKRSVETGGPVSDEMRLGIRRQEQRLIKFHVMPMFSEGTVTGAVIRAEDVQALRALEQMRSDFAANVSHELKTPLTSIRGFVETLLNGAIDEREQALHFLNIINMETARLNRLITDILTLSNIESGNLPEFAPINLQVLVEETLEFVRPAAEDKDISLTWENEYGTPVYVTGHTDWIKQMLIDLADNAIKYTGEGGKVEIEIGQEGKEALLRVRDNGIGIAEKDIQRIFERFYRADKSRSRALGSTGLGLAIVKHIVSRMNGQIEVKSKVGKGTEFVIRLPGAASGKSGD